MCEALRGPEGSSLAAYKQKGGFARWLRGREGPVAPEEAAGADPKLLWPRRVRAGLPGSFSELSHDAGVPVGPLMLLLGLGPR